jgi:CRP/FNR family cyclic AMP-dependent transcriptional regulator
METTRQILDSHPFLAGLAPEALERLSAYASKSVFRTGQEIFHEGGLADRFWLLRDGEVALELRTGDRRLRVGTLGAGDVLGWSWLNPPYRWHFDAVALSLAHAVELNAKGVRRLCDADPVLGHQLKSRFLAVVVDRMQASRMRLLTEEASA